MFTAILSVITKGFADIYWKKSLSFGVGGKIHDLLGYGFGIMIMIYFFYSGMDLSKSDIYIISSVVALLIVGIFKTQLIQKIYKSEKISIIMPYTNINKILTIVLSFFIFSDVSKTSLFITLLALIIIILFSIDFKTLKVPKTMKLLLVTESIVSLTALTSGYFILHYGVEMYFSIFLISGLFFLFILSAILGQFKTIKNQPKKFWIYRITGSIGWIAWFLSLLVIKQLGLSILILLSFLGIGITLFLSYMILDDKPTKKDLLLTVIVTVLVGLGYYFK